MFSPFCSEPSAPPVTLTIDQIHLFLLIAQLSKQALTMATNTNALLKYEDIISKCTLIYSGSPAHYQLPALKKELGSIRRMTLGKKDPNKISKTIWLVGETGTGKSTLVNTLVNYAMGVKFEDNIWFEIIEEKRSQTSDVIVYEIFGFEGKTLPFSLTIIDTPGCRDTRGIEHDVIISQSTFDLFCSENGIQEVNAVGLVVKATECRLNDQLQYVLKSVMSLFGKDLEENIVALITYSNGRPPKNVLQALDAANIKCAKNEKNQSVHFLFDNCQDEDRTDDIQDLKHADKITMKGMKQFTEFLEQTAPQKLQITKEVLKERIQLTACINNLQDRIKLIELKQSKIQQTEEALKKHEQEMKENEEFTSEVEETYKDKEPIDGGMWWLVFYEGAVTCNVCEENCHHPGCTMAWDASWCKVMNKGHCTVCPGKCPASDHVKEKWIYANKTRKGTKTKQDVKEKYEKERMESEKKTSHLEDLDKEMQNLEAEKTQLMEEYKQHHTKLEQIALCGDSRSPNVVLSPLIEKIKEKQDKEGQETGGSISGERRNKGKAAEPVY
ncbi:uncharacterized protein LOC121886180 [Thunnus maccoyii]|uniref:uncharacterized protein LOC121886180 n=1 Tax=Thunnus maccoyii TaxID=8240 RepID=UPI001C4C30D4|nr:uncharacterized protein LOC121886180 [Thunnus maccoyii]